MWAACDGVDDFLCVRCSANPKDPTLLRGLLWDAWMPTLPSLRPPRLRASAFSGKPSIASKRFGYGSAALRLCVSKISPFSFCVLCVLLRLPRFGGGSAALGLSGLNPRVDQVRYGSIIRRPRCVYGAGQSTSSTHPSACAASRNIRSACKRGPAICCALTSFNWPGSVSAFFCKIRRASGKV